MYAACWLEKKKLSWRRSWHACPEHFVTSPRKHTWGAAAIDRGSVRNHTHWFLHNGWATRVSMCKESWERTHTFNSAEVPLSISLRKFPFLFKVVLFERRWGDREVRWREIERETETFYLLVYTSHTCNSLGWSRLEAGAQSSIPSGCCRDPLPAASQRVHKLKDALKQSSED